MLKSEVERQVALFEKKVNFVIYFCRTLLTGRIYRILWWRGGRLIAEPGKFLQPIAWPNKRMANIIASHLCSREGKISAGLLFGAPRSFKVLASADTIQTLHLTLSTSHFPNIKKLERRTWTLSKG